MAVSKDLVRLQDCQNISTPAFLHNEKAFMSVLKNTSSKAANIGMCWWGVVEGRVGLLSFLILIITTLALLYVLSHSGGA
jgi:hypothetical protein